MPRIAASIAVLATAAFCIGFNITQYPVVWQSIGAGGPLSHSVESSQSAATGPGSESLPDSDPGLSAAWAEDSAAGAPIVAAISGSADFDESEGPPDFADPDPEPTVTESWGYDATDAFDGPPEGGDACTGGQCRIDNRGSIDPQQPEDYWASPDGPQDAFAGDAEDPAAAWRSTKYAATPVEPPEDQRESAASNLWNPQSELVPVRRPGRSLIAAVPLYAQASSDWQAEGNEFAFDHTVRRLPPIDQIWDPDPNGYEPALPASSIPIYPTTGIDSLKL